VQIPLLPNKGLMPYQQVLGMVFSKRPKYKQLFLRITNGSQMFEFSKLYQFQDSKKEYQDLGFFFGAAVNTTTSGECIDLMFYQGGQNFDFQNKWMVYTADDAFDEFLATQSVDMTKPGTSILFTLSDLQAVIER
jgi:hypothetical protein